MAVTVPDGFGIASLIFRCNGIQDDIVSTIGFQPETISDPGTWAHRIYDAWTTAPAPFAANQITVGWSFTGVSVSVTEGTETRIGQWLVPLTGTFAGSAVPVNCAVLVRKNTGRGGKKGRGRMYLPPTRMPEDGVSPSGQLDSVWVGSWQGGVTAALDAMITSEVPAFLMHEDGSAPDQINSLTVMSQLATQRRRMR